VNESGRFQSTLPAKGATQYGWERQGQPDISIHAPRKGSDKQDVFDFSGTVNFNPRSPQRERPLAEFNTNPYDIISIHAPRKGSDINFGVVSLWQKYFNPRSPQRERRDPKGELYIACKISIHAPRKGSDSKNAQKIV